MEQRNEPTTAEIVKAIRSCNASGGCMACREIGIDSDCETLELLAADRLESQAKENEISRHLIEMQSNVITELTARAEKAEAEAKERGERAFKADAMVLLLKAQVSDEQELRKQAEAERDAAVKWADDFCNMAQSYNVDGYREPDDQAESYYDWKRGLRGKGNA